MGAAAVRLLLEFKLQLVPPPHNLRKDNYAISSLDVDGHHILWRNCDVHA